MPDPSWFENPLPHGLDQAVIEAWAKRFAPWILFHRDERHFPSTPESFHMKSRFRESLQGRRDQGWKQGPGWETPGDKEDPSYEIDWKVIEMETAVRIGDRVGQHPSLRPTLRPHGGRNLFRLAGRPKQGLFLERDRIANRSSSGNAPVSGIVTAPVFLDAVPVETRAGSFVKVLFWFFYELNRWHGLLTHEGDWEHVTYLAKAKSIKKLKPPSHVYFAQHNTGELRRWTDLESADTDHPTLYVDQHGHPTKPSVSNFGDYRHEWSIWKQEFEWIRDADWHEYSGAWGEVGETKHTTGPLGPWFKQDGDLVRVKHDASGNLIICIPND